MKTKAIHPLVVSAMAQAFGGLPFLKENFDRATMPIEVSLEEWKAREVIALARDPATKNSVRKIFGGQLKWTNPNVDTRSLVPQCRIYFCVVQ